MPRAKPQARSVQEPSRSPLRHGGTKLARRSKDRIAIDIIGWPRPEEARSAVSKDGHKWDRASGHPSRRPRFARAPQDEVCGFEFHPSDRFVEPLTFTCAYLFT